MKLHNYKYIIISLFLLIFINSYSQYRRGSLSPQNEALIAKVIHGLGMIIPLKIATADKDLIIPFYLLTAFTSSTCFTYLESQKDYWKHSFTKLGLHAATIGILYLTVPIKRADNLIDGVFYAFRALLIAAIFLLIELSYIIYYDYSKIEQLTKANAISWRIDLSPNFKAPGLTLSFSF